jgi:hypothetical protein
LSGPQRLSVPQANLFDDPFEEADGGEEDGRAGTA